jgi:hypothetical protein
MRLSNVSDVLATLPSTLYDHDTIVRTQEGQLAKFAVGITKNAIVRAPFDLSPITANELRWHGKSLI